MASSADALHEQQVEKLAREVQLIHEHGAVAWRRDGGPVGLPTIDGLGQVRAMVAAGKERHEAIWEAVQQACNGLLKGWMNTALAYLGYSYEKPKPGGRDVFEARRAEKSPDARAKAAAGLIPCDVRTFRSVLSKATRTYGPQRFHSYEVLLTAVIAGELLGQSLVTDPAAPDDGSEDDLPPFDAVAAYVPVEPKHLEDGFWWRDSTQHYIESIARESCLTIYAGADGQADVGEPKHDLAVAALLKHCLKSDSRLAGVTDQARTSHLAQTAALFADSSPSFLGSIIRGLYELRSVNPLKVDSGLQRVLDTLIEPRAEEESREIEAFVSGGIASLALEFGVHGKPTSIVTAHYDDDVFNQVQQGAKAMKADHDGEMRAQLEAVARRGPERRHLSTVKPSKTNDSVPPVVICLHGDPKAQPTSRLMLSETDLFLGSGDSSGEKPSWFHVLKVLFERVPSLFVGTDIRAPGLVTALIETKRSPHSRYAILLADPSRQPPSALPDPRPEGEDERQSRSLSLRKRIDVVTAAAADAHARVGRSLYLNALAARYVHLGVVPVIAEFPYQVPSFLQEVALRVRLGDDNYTPYCERCDTWWRNNSPALGFGAPPGGEAPSELQLKCYSGLRAMRYEIAASHADGGETLAIEAWIRNPVTRELFLWASSEGYWSPSDTAPTASLLVPGDATQQTFREGITMWGDIKGEWRYFVSMPLVLAADYPWYGLPVGVVKVLSSKENGGLAAIATGGHGNVLENRNDELVALVPSLINPQSD